MRISNVGNSALTTAIALAALAGCGGGSQMTPSSLALTGVGSTSIQGPAFQNGRPNSFLTTHEGIVPGHGATTPSFMDPAAVGKPLVFLSDANANGNVYIFLQKGKHKMVGQITGLGHPLGLAVDVANNLYIANAYTSTVPVYAPPYTGAPILTLNSYFPEFVAVSAKGVVAVINGNVSFYAKNSTTACATVAGSNPISAGAFDHAGNLYLAGQIVKESNAFIGEIRGGCKATKVKLLKTNNALGQLAGVQVDKAGRVAFLALDSAIIYTYNPPKHGSLGNPVSTTTLGTAGGGFSFAFLASGRDLYANINLMGAYKFAYPAGGAAEGAILFPFHGDVAVSPSLIP